jgi:hypothetical protein
MKSFFIFVPPFSIAPTQSAITPNSGFAYKAFYQQLSNPENADHENPREGLPHMRKQLLSD